MDTTKQLNDIIAAFFEQCEKKSGAYMDYKIFKIAFLQYMHKHCVPLPYHFDKFFITLLGKEGVSTYGYDPTVVVGLRLRSWITD